PSSDLAQSTWQIDTAALYLYDAGNIYYQGNITSDLIIKPSSASWSHVYAEVNNTTNSTFKILDVNHIPIINDIASGQDISSISDNSIYLFCSFNGSVKLESWNVTASGTDWTADGIDTTSADWSWTFTFPSASTNLTRIFYFYSIGQKTNWPAESPPSTPDAVCQYEG
ncbi:MAG: hypothetical protein V1769_02520, partial [Thermoplasmatota archaeon]